MKASLRIANFGGSTLLDVLLPQWAVLAVVRMFYSSVLVHLGN
jgi:hypothetical protein